MKRKNKLMKKGHVTCIIEGLLTQTIKECIVKPCQIINCLVSEKRSVYNYELFNVFRLNVSYSHQDVLVHKPGYIICMQIYISAYVDVLLVCVHDWFFIYALKLLLKNLHYAMKLSLLYFKYLFSFKKTDELCMGFLF